jgi:hypothetical protein
VCTATGVGPAYALFACDPPEPDELEESVEGFDDDPESDELEDDPESEEPEELDSDPDPDEPEPDPDEDPELSFSFEAPFDDDRLSVL